MDLQNAVAQTEDHDAYSDIWLIWYYAPYYNELSYNYQAWPRLFAPFLRSTNTIIKVYAYIWNIVLYRHEEVSLTEGNVYVSYEDIKLLLYYSTHTRASVRLCGCACVYRYIHMCVGKARALGRAHELKWWRKGRGILEVSESLSVHWWHESRQTLIRYSISDCTRDHP